MNGRIFIGRIPEKATKEDLEEEFIKFGRIKKVDLKGSYAFIEYEDYR